MDRSSQALRSGVYKKILLFQMVAVLMLILSGCGNEESPYEGDPSRKWLFGGPYCQPDSSGKFSETPLVFNSDSQATGSNGYHYAEGGACIARPLKEVLSASHHNSSFEWDESHLDGNPSLGKDSRVDFFFTALHRANAWSIVWFKIQWFQTVTEGTAAAPKVVTVNFNKSDGTTFIKYWDGNIVLYEVAPNVTGFDMRQHVEARDTDLEKVKNGLTRRLQSYRTAPAEWKYLAR
jgi:hypothetical protein